MLRMHEQHGYLKKMTRELTQQVSAQGQILQGQLLEKIANAQSENEKSLRTDRNINVSAQHRATLLHSHNTANY